MHDPSNLPEICLTDCPFDRWHRFYRKLCRNKTNNLLILKGRG